jgi:NADPH-dependent 2,4-dienoyl-CoA reductase/sulfur reductase-like enzyme
VPVNRRWVANVTDVGLLVRQRSSPQCLTNRPAEVHPPHIHRTMKKVIEMTGVTGQTGCVIIGGGPAGMVAGLLLARAGSR